MVDFHYDGRPRRWLRAFDTAVDVEAKMTDDLRNLYGGHAKLVQVRHATPDEDEQYLRGDLPSNAICPTGR